MNDPLFGNKIAAAVLTALLLVFGLPQLTAAILGGGHHGGHHDELKLAYCCVELDFAAAAGEAAVEEAYDLGAMLASASVSSGERRAALCQSCHTFDEGGANGTGPNLWNVVGRQVAGVSGFNYSSALRDFGGEWTYERLDEYLRNSQEYVPGTAMVQRIGRDQQRAEILAYLGSLSSNPVDYPAPNAPAVEEARAETE
ncbi:MAG: c-type cytochrome [Hyphococcus sp.]